tara:strand:- start:1885 stop:2622 length:738 start_codon:yes stop_codon:yes gene_type:complete
MIKQFLKSITNSFLRLFNLRLSKITLSNDFFYYILKTLNHFKIDIVIDIGANKGQFAEKLINIGFNKKILSFEPMEKVYEILKKKTQNYNNWEAPEKIGFGNKIENKTLNISQNSVSSSILKMNKGHILQEPSAKFINKEKIKLTTLNNYLNDKKFRNKKIFVKIDTQGYEKNIILGASKVLKKIQGIMLETSILTLYKGEEDFLKMIKFMKKKGFYIWSIERGFSNKYTGRVVQLDIIFINKNA